MLILPPHGFGSIGDEAMIISAIQNFKSRYDLDSDILAFSSEGRWIDRVEHIDGFCGEIVVNGRFGNPFNTKNIISIISKYELFVIVGADIMDGAYSVLQSCKRFILLRQAARLGIKSILLGSSFNNNISREVIEYLKELNGFENIKLNVRDKLSYDRIKMFYCNAVPVMDCGFLLDSIRMDDDISYFAENNDFIAINLNSIHYKKYGDIFIYRLAQDIEKIVKIFSLSVILTPHDIREESFGVPSDLALCKKIYSKINSDLSEKIRIVENRQLLNAPYLKWLASKAVLVVTGRMHFAIAALGSGTPVLCMTYQDKFEGMLSVFTENEEDWILSNYIEDTNLLINKINKYVRGNFIAKKSIGVGLIKAKLESSKNYDF